MRAGAFRKAVQRLSSRPFACSADEEATWAAEMLPSAGRELRAPRDVEPAQGAATQLGDVHGDDDLDERDAPKPLQGVHFAAESAPGPSGRRPEHLRDLLACPRRRATRRLLFQLDRLQGDAARGQLPESLDWLLRTRVVYIDKKGSPKPRPLRVGELLRRVVAKRALWMNRPRVVQRMLKSRQFGVALPGGGECLIHWRATVVEEIRSDPAHGVWALIDLDWQNCYPSLEWDDVEESTERWVPALGPWTRWCHGIRVEQPGGDADQAPETQPMVERACQPALLPSGGLHLTARGAEQGDPLGSLQCGLVLSDVSDDASVAREARAPGAPALDVWFADDAQVLCRPSLVELFLETMDAAAAGRGARRGRGADCKSRVRLIGHADALSTSNDDWITDCVRESCFVDTPNAPFVCLGTSVGDANARVQQFERQVDKVNASPIYFSTIKIF